MQDFHQRLQWQHKSEPDHANILGKYILGAKNNFRDFNTNEPVRYENTGLQISAQPNEEDPEKAADIKAGGDVSEREEEPGSESPTETLPEEEMTSETVSTPDESETNSTD